MGGFLPFGVGCVSRVHVYELNHHPPRTGLLLITDCGQQLSWIVGKLKK
jgi:hypothetical protein